MALVAGQDVEPAEGSDGTDGRWRIARRVAPERVISVVDPQARHVHKTVHHRQDGYKAHVAVEPDTGLFTAGEVTEAAGEDNHEAVVGLALLDEDTEPGELEVLGDSAYGTGQARAALTQAGHTAIIKPAPLRPAVPGGFTLDDFTVDEAAGTVTCPNGVTRTLTRHAPPPSAPPAAPARYVKAAPAPKTAGPCGYTNTTPCSGTPAATGPPTPTCVTPTANTGPWSNAPSPG